MWLAAGPRITHQITKNQPRLGKTILDFTTKDEKIFLKYGKKKKEKLWQSTRVTCGVGV